MIQARLDSTHTSLEAAWKLGHPALLGSLGCLTATPGFMA